MTITSVFFALICVLGLRNRPSLLLASNWLYTRKGELASICTGEGRASQETDDNALSLSPFFYSPSLLMWFLFLDQVLRGEVLSTRCFPVSAFNQ